VGRIQSLFSRRRLIALGILAVLAAVAFSQWQAAIHRNRSIPDEPLRIAGNLYYVGHTGVASYLLTGPEGHVLIDGGYPEHGPLIINSIAELGFDIRDVKILLNSHPHSDHAGALKDLQEASGAELWVSEGDAAVMASGGRGDRGVGIARHLWYLGLLRFDAPQVDRTFENGDVIRLGPIELVANVTAGHTRGCTSWSFPVQVEADTLLAVSICSLTLFPFVSLDPEAYPGINADFRSSYRTLRELPADIFLASHTDWFGMSRKRRAQAEADREVDPFIDPDGYKAFIDAQEQIYLERAGPQW
jgi:metallo-beta-lactamase class B